MKMLMKMLTLISLIILVACYTLTLTLMIEACNTVLHQNACHINIHSLLQSLKQKLEVLTLISTLSLGVLVFGLMLMLIEGDST